MDWRLENLNYARDHRNRRGPRLVVEIDEVEHELPTKWEVCSVCDGEGKHVNPSIDCNGLSAEDFDEDPDFAEAYFDGAYDVPCNRCNGRSTERVVDWDKVPPELRAAYERQAREEADYQAERWAEIRMGC